MLTGEPQPLTVQTSTLRTHLLKDEAAARRSPVQHVVRQKSCEKSTIPIFINLLNSSRKGVILLPYFI